MNRKLLVGLVASAGALLSVPSAEAFTTLPVWQCRGSVAFTSIAGQNRVEPLVANGNINTANGVSPDRAQCVDSETGAGNTATQLGISPNFVTAVTGRAATSIEPDLGRAIDQTAGAFGQVEDLGLLLNAGAPTIGIGAANSTATGRCVSGNLNPVFSGDSRVADITLGGTPIPLDRLATELTNILNPLIGAVVEVRVDERISTPTSLTINAIHIIVLRGTTPLADIVAGQARVLAAGPVCDPTKQNDGGNNLNGICPRGAELDAVNNVCVIRAATSGSSLGDIVVGRPFQGPSGGTVIPIDIARRRFGRSPCLGFSGNPKFAIVGTNRGDRITGTNIADRIIGLGGNDRLDGGRGNDCIEGRTGGDNMSGGLGNDRIYGSSGKDHLNGGPGTDYLSAGTGNDTINAAFGRDRTFGGEGRDFINIATAGPAASANCGPGRGDVVRINNNERRRVRGCERIAVFTGNER